MRPQLGRGSLSRASISGALILALVCVGPTALSAQGSAPTNSPTEVVRAYRKMDGAGERLTNSGWYRSSAFFLKPSPPPRRIVMFVIDGERVDGPLPVGGNRAEVQVGQSLVGQIDSSGRFTSVVSPPLIDHLGQSPKQPIAAELYGPEIIDRVYELVLTNTHWEFGPGGKDLREVKGPPEWRLEHFEYEPEVRIEAAIRYLTRLRDESTSETIKRNVEQSIATLRGLH